MISGVNMMSIAHFLRRVVCLVFLLPIGTCKLSAQILNEDVIDGEVVDTICADSISGEITSIFSSGAFPGPAAIISYGSAAIARNQVHEPNNYGLEVEVYESLKFEDPVFVIGFGHGRTLPECSAVIGWGLDGNHSFNLGTYIVVSRVFLLTGSTKVYLDTASTYFTVE
jgi:hypothetical protein